MTEKETSKEDEEMCLRDCENTCKRETMVGDGERESGGENAGEEQEGNLERNDPENEERSAKNEGDLKDVQPNTQVTLDLISQGLISNWQVEGVQAPGSGQRSDEMKPEFQPEKKADDDEFELKRPKSKGGDHESKMENILLEDDKVAGYKRDLDGNTGSSREWKERFEWLEASPSLPLLETPLPTGVACCLTRCSKASKVLPIPNFRLIQMGLQKVTFYLSGLAQVVPLACTERHIRRSKTHGKNNIFFQVYLHSGG